MFVYYHRRRANIAGAIGASYILSVAFIILFIVPDFLREPNSSSSPPIFDPWYIALPIIIGAVFILWTFGRWLLEHAFFHYCLSVTAEVMRRYRGRSGDFATLFSALQQSSPEIASAKDLIKVLRLR